MSELAPPPADAPLILVADDVPANVELLFDQLHVAGIPGGGGVATGPRRWRIAGAAFRISASSTCRCRRGTSASMTATTGFEVCRRIKRDARTARIPVIFVTALNDTTDRVKAIEAGGDDFLTKPHNRLVLGARVALLLKLKGATDALEESLAQARNCEKMRDDLMKMIVHDLKTPLTSMLGALEMVRRRGLRRAHERRSAARSPTRRRRREDLLALIEDLLEVARIEEKSLTAAARAASRPAALLAEVVVRVGMRVQQERRGGCGRGGRRCARRSSADRRSSSACSAT